MSVIALSGYLLQQLHVCAAALYHRGCKVQLVIILSLKYN